MRFSKFITAAKINEITHTSGFANSANKGRFGASSNSSFKSRQEIEEKRKNVQSYNHSRLVLNHVARNKRFATPQDSAKIEAKNYIQDIVKRNSAPNSGIPDSGIAKNPTQRPKITFIEPAPRRRGY